MRPFVRSRSSWLLLPSAMLLLPLLSDQASASPISGSTITGPILTCPSKPTLADCQGSFLPKFCHDTFVAKCRPILGVLTSTIAVAPSETRVVPKLKLGGFSSLEDPVAIDLAARATPSTTPGLATSPANITPAHPVNTGTSLAPQAIAHVQPLPLARATRVDMMSYQSQRDAWRRDMQYCAGRVDDFCNATRRKYSSYEGHDTVGWCGEYAWAKFAELSRYEDLVVLLGTNYRNIVDVAFATSTSVGKAHSGDGATGTTFPKSYTRNGKGWGVGFLHGRQPKNALVTFAEVVNDLRTVDAGTPSQKLTYASYYAQGDDVLRPWHTWFYHDVLRAKKFPAKMRIGAIRRPEFSTYLSDVDLNMLYDLQKEFTKLSATYVAVKHSSAPPVVCNAQTVPQPWKRGDEVINPNPYDRSLYGAGIAADVVGGVLATAPELAFTAVDRALLDGVNATAVATPISGAISHGIVTSWSRGVLGTRSLGQVLAQPPMQTMSLSGGSCGDQAGNAAQFVVDRLRRMDLLRRQIEPYLKAFEGYGCLDMGVTACDWSPKYFVDAVLPKTDKIVEDAYQSCLAHAPNPFSFSDPTVDPTDELGTPSEGDQLTNNLTAYSWGIKSFGAPTSAVAIPIDQITGLSSEDRATLEGVAHTDPTTHKKVLDGPALSAYCKDPGVQHYADSVYDFERFAKDQPRMKLKRRVCKIAAYATKLLSDSNGRLAGTDGAIYAPQFHSVHSYREGGSFFGAGYNLESQFVLRKVGPATVSPKTYVCPEPAFVSKMNATATILGAERTMINATADVRGTQMTVGLVAFDETIALQPGEAFHANSAGAPPAAYTHQWDSSNTVADGYVSLLGIPIHYTAGYTGAVGITTARLGGSFQCDAVPSPSGPTWPLPKFGSLDGVRIEPFVKVGGWVQASVDVGVASAGVRGALTLVDIGLPMTSVVQVDPGYEGASAVSATARTVRKATVGYNTSLAMTFLSGNIEAFAEIDLGLWSDSASMTLASWSGISKNEPLAADQYSFAMEDLRRYFDILGKEPAER